MYHGVRSGSLDSIAFCLSIRTAIPFFGLSMQSVSISLLKYDVSACVACLLGKVDYQKL
jgi:hypothetical protein